MLQSSNRLRQSLDFSRAFSRGRQVKGRFGKLVVSARPDSSPTRVGIIISSKRGKATKRNKMKRQIREVFYSLLPRINSGHDIIYIVWNAEFDFESISQEIVALLKTSGILQDDEINRDRHH